MTIVTRRFLRAGGTKDGHDYVDKNYVSELLCRPVIDRRNSLANTYSFILDDSRPAEDERRLMGVKKENDRGKRGSGKKEDRNERK